jgi:hypothetical protein
LEAGVRNRIEPIAGFTISKYRAQIPKDSGGQRGRLVRKGTRVKANEGSGGGGDPPRRGVGEREGIPLPGRNQTADADRGNNPRDVITV